MQSPTLWLRSRDRRLGLALGLSLTACASEPASQGDDVTRTSDAVTVDTSAPVARRQYDANVTFATSYTARCGPTANGRPRVLLTGFGRFMNIHDNPTGRIVSEVVPTARYPETRASAPGVVDPPGNQVSVGTATLSLAHVGLVDVCAMILPVTWDLAAILIAKEMEAFHPSFVLMNGAADARQPLWIELGSVNSAARLDDGSQALHPLTNNGRSETPLIEDAAPEESARPNLLSWRAVEGAARTIVTTHAGDRDGRATLSDTLTGVKLSAFPRTSNTYLCNNVTYVTGYLMSHPRKDIALLRASPAIEGSVNEVKVRLTRDLNAVPRVFLHWPSQLAQSHVRVGVEITKAIMDAQLFATSNGDLPTYGDNAIANFEVSGGNPR